jgi:hypothetical protein
MPLSIGSRVDDMATEPVTFRIVWHKILLKKAEDYSV